MQQSNCLINCQVISSVHGPNRIIGYGLLCVTLVARSTAVGNDSWASLPGESRAECTCLNVDGTYIIYSRASAECECQDSNGREIPPFQTVLPCLHPRYMILTTGMLTFCHKRVTWACYYHAKVYYKHWTYAMIKCHFCPVYKCCYSAVCVFVTLRWYCYLGSRHC